MALGLDVGVGGDEDIIPLGGNFGARLTNDVSRSLVLLLVTVVPALNESALEPNSCGSKLV